ncbi:MAG: hydantoinase B/oxoprolinase family protein, partial [candidate division NC10 bacterium]|nr:hydantoinase B/oxoprolinase family protein [candidate division NC10 bacterium]
GAQALAEAVLAAFAEGLAHLTRAPDASPVLLDLRGERADGTRYRMRLEVCGGLGASVFGDGMTHASPEFQPQRLRSVEAIERAAPLRVQRFELRPDSAGPGQYRGGLGAAVTLEFLEGRATVDVLLPGRPMGLRGGMRGGGARLVLVTPEEGVREQTGPAQVTLDLRAGHRLHVESPGGGGWGLPFQRSIMRIEGDLAGGIITRDQSRNRYGVILKPGSLEKDDHLTYRIRHYLLSTLAAEDIIAGEELLD